MERHQERTNMTSDGSTTSASARTPVPTHTTPTHERKHDYSYYKAVFKGRRMPFAYLDLDLLDQNIHAILAHAGGKQIRLASKSLRSIAVIQHILAADSTFQGMMCFTAQEAAYLAAQGLNDLLIGYPIWHEEDLA